MNEADRGQVSGSAAEIYEAFFVPALLGQWAEILLDVAGVAEGHHVLDVGCGTGVVARAALRRVGSDGHVTGIDPNEGMLTVARRLEPQVEWHTGLAEQLPFPDHSFDRTVSQFALMFFTDRAAAMAETSRVTRPEGSVAFAVWDDIEYTPGYARLAVLIDELFGSDAADAIRAPFVLGDENALRQLAEPALKNVEVIRRPGVARFESLQSWLHTEIRGWTLADIIDDAGFEALLDTAQARLGDLASEDGVAFEISTLIVSGSPS